jgi:hypothetical protein
MTAHQLARKLLEGPDVMVTVRGYEGGVDEITGIQKPEELILNFHDKDSWYYGNHEYNQYDEKETHHTTVQAIHIHA